MTDEIKKLSQHGRGRSFAILASIRHLTHLMMNGQEYGLLEFEEDCKRLQMKVDQLFGLIQEAGNE
jgi:hypothetical protein